jgi:hypothetical protein
MISLLNNGDAILTDIIHESTLNAGKVISKFTGISGPARVTKDDASPKS